MSSDDDAKFITLGPFLLDRLGRQVSRGGEKIALGGRAFDVLWALALAGGEAVTKEELLRQGWPGQTVDENNLQVQISGLRRALGDAVITTVPGRGYRLAVIPHTPRTLASDAIAGKPSVAVLPFANLSRRAGQEVMADGITDDLITELSRYHSFFVIARSTSFFYRGYAVDIRHVAKELGARYILTGTVRREVSRLRVTAQLTDAETANNLWAGKFDRPVRDIFAVQDEIIGAVGSAIRPTVDAAELRRALRKPPESLGAWEAYQRGLWHLLSHRLEELSAARVFFNRAIEIDQGLSAAYAGLASLYIVESGYFGLRPFEEGAILAANEARKAIALNPNDADAHAALAFALSNQRDYETAAEHIRHALDASPSCSAAYQVRGMNLLFSEEPSKAREDLVLARRLDPRGVHSVTTISVQIGMSHYFEHDYDQAAEILRRTIADNESNPMAYRWLAAALGQLGLTEEARRALDRAMSGWPDSFDRYTRKRAPWFRPHVFEHMLDGLRKAGWQP
jgi:adenylate cyclase